MSEALSALQRSIENLIIGHADHRGVINNLSRGSLRQRDNRCYPFNASAPLAGWLGSYHAPEVAAWKRRIASMCAAGSVRPAFMVLKLM